MCTYAIRISTIGCLFGVTCHDHSIVNEIKRCFGEIADVLLSGVGRVYNINELKCNRMVAVLVGNRDFKRGNILHVAGEDEIQVELVDEGKKVICNLNQLRLLDNLKQTFDLNIIHIQALPGAFVCYLKEVFSIYPWKSDEDPDILQLLKGNSIQRGYGLEKEWVELFVGNDRKNFSDILINCNLATRTADSVLREYLNDGIADQNAEPISRGAVPSSTGLKVYHDRNKIVQEGNYRQKRNSDNTIGLNFKFSGMREKDRYVKNKYAPALMKAPKLCSNFILPKYHKNSVMDVTISWFVSPESFFANPVNPDFMNLMKCIQEEYSNIIPVDNVKVGDCVIARFSYDKKLYRAVVKAISNSKVRVQFVDYGNTSTCAKSEVWAVNPLHYVVPIQAIHCSLHDITPPGGSKKWDILKYDDWCDYFNKDMYAISIVESSMRDDMGDVLYKVRLYDQDNQNIAHKLINDGWASKPISIPAISSRDIPLLVGQIIPVYSPHVVSSMKFYLHLEPDNARKIISLVNDVDEFEMIRLSTKQLHKGTFCLVKDIGNARWRRARILHFNEVNNVVNVIYVDYGIEHSTTPETIFMLPDNLKSYADLAVECSLQINGLMSEKLEDKFKHLVSNSDLIAVIELAVNYKLVVTLFDADGQHIQLPETSDRIVENPLPMPILRPSGTFRISHLSVEDGELIGFIQNDPDYELSSSQAALNDAVSISSMSDTIRIGSVYAVKSDKYESWYRAKVISVSNCGYCVYYLDYGDTELLPNPKNFRSLNKIFYYKPEYCLKVYLRISILNRCDLDALHDFVFEKQFSVKLQKYKNRCDAEMILNGKSITNICLELGIGSKVNIMIDETVNRLNQWPVIDNLKITNYISPNKFWVQLAKDTDKLQIDIQEDIACTKYSVATYLASLDPEGNLWYQSQYGTNQQGQSNNFDSSTQVGSVKYLTSYITEKEPLAIMCELDLEPMNREWDDKVHIYFRKSLNSKIIGDILIKQPHCLTINLNINGENISELLLKEGLCKPKTREVVISYFESFNEFYVQTFETDLIYDLQEKLQEICKNCPPIIPKVGDLVGVISTFGLWCRALVKSVNDDAYTVQYVDYGDTVVISDVRSLPKDIANIPYFAIKCGLYTEEENLKKYERPFVDMLNSSDVDYHFFINFVKYYPDILVNMTYSNRDIIYLLKSLVIKEETEHPFEDNEINVDEALIADENNMSLVMKVTDEVAVSNIVSLQEFWIINKTSMRNITSELANCSDFENSDISTTNVGSIVAALYPMDLSWYRAKILDKLPDNQIRVFYIDYGDIGVTSQVKNLPADLVNLPPMAKKCKLYLPYSVPEWPANALNNFIKIVDNVNNKIEVHIMDSGDPLTVSLTVNGADLSLQLLLSTSHDYQDDTPQRSDSVSELSCEKNGEQIIINSVIKNTEIDEIQKSLKILITRFKNILPLLNDNGLLHHNVDEQYRFVNGSKVKVSYFRDPHWFFIQLADLDMKLNEIENSLLDGEHFERITRKVDFNSLVACHTKKTWYRAKVEVIIPDKYIEALCIDYGYRFNVLINDLRELPENLKNIPPLARCCSLPFIPLISPSDNTNSSAWPNELLERFKKFICHGAPIHQLIMIKEAVPSIINLINGDQLDAVTAIKNMAIDMIRHHEFWDQVETAGPENDEDIIMI